MIIALVRHQCCHSHLFLRLLELLMCSSAHVWSRRLYPGGSRAELSSSVEISGTKFPERVGAVVGEAATWVGQKSRSKGMGKLLEYRQAAKASSGRPVAQSLEAQRQKQQNGHSSWFSSYPNPTGCFYSSPKH